MAYENYSINQFMNALFSGNYTKKGIPKDQLDIVYIEYIDTAALYEKEEFHIISYIHKINNRINAIKMSIALQRRFVSEFGIAYLPGIDFIKKFGHPLKWINAEQFLEDLEKVEVKESKFVSQLEGKIQELHKLREKKGKKESVEKLDRQQFIKTLNSLGKIGYKIDKDKTTVEELALMIKQQFEDSKS